MSRLGSSKSVQSHPKLKSLIPQHANYDTIGDVEHESLSLDSLDNERYYMFVCILLAFFAIHTTNMNVSTIIPTHVSHNHLSLSEIQISYIIM